MFLIILMMTMMHSLVYPHYISCSDAFNILLPHNSRTLNTNGLHGLLQLSLSSLEECDDLDDKQEQDENTRLPPIHDNTTKMDTSQQYDDTINNAIDYKIIEQALQNVYKVWDLKSTSSVHTNKLLQSAIESSPELTIALSTSLTNVQTFATNVGRIPKQRLRNMIQYHPKLLAQAIQSKQIQSIREVTLVELGWTDTQWEKAKQKCKHTHHRWSRTNVRKVIYLFQTRLLDLTQNQLQTIFTSNPQLLGMQSSTLCQTFDFFQNEIELDSISISRMVRTVPTVLAYSIDHKLRPTIEFLQYEVGGGSGEWNGWKRIISRYPQCLTQSLENVLRPNVSFLQNDVLHLQRLSDVAKIVSLFPPTMWLQTTLIERKVQYLKSSLQLSKEEVRDVIVTFPQILGLSVEHNLMAKIDFFLSDAEMTHDQLKDFVLYQPALLAYSLEGRLRPRIKQLQHSSITFGYTPPYLMSLSDDKFKNWLDMHTGDWSISY